MGRCVDADAGVGGAEGVGVAPVVFRLVFSDLSFQDRGTKAAMTFKVLAHRAEEGGYWAEVPAIKGCFSLGETIDELLENIREALQGCLIVLNERQIRLEKDAELYEVAV